MDNNNKSSISDMLLSWRREGHMYNWNYKLLWYLCILIDSCYYYWHRNRKYNSNNDKSIFLPKEDINDDTTEQNYEYEQHEDSHSIVIATAFSTALQQQSTIWIALCWCHQVLVIFDLILCCLYYDYVLF